MKPISEMTKDDLLSLMESISAFKFVGRQTRYAIFSQAEKLGITSREAGLALRCKPNTITTWCKLNSIKLNKAEAPGAPIPPPKLPYKNNNFSLDTSLHATAFDLLGRKWVA